jgi:hypothetical protein
MKQINLSTQAASRFTPIGELSSTEDLAHEDAGTLGADPAQTHQLLDQRLVSLLQLGAPCGLDLAKLLLDELQARELAFDLRARFSPQLFAMLPPPADPIAAADGHAGPQVVRRRERADAVGVCRALLDFGGQVSTKLTPARGAPASSVNGRRRSLSRAVISGRHGWGAVYSWRGGRREAVTAHASRARRGAAVQVAGIYQRSASLHCVSYTCERKP